MSNQDSFYLNFQGFTYCSIFDFQGSLLLSVSAATRLVYQMLFCLSTTFLIYFWTFLEVHVTYCSDEWYIITAADKRQHFFNQQFTRSFLGTDFMLAWESVHGKLRRERRSMSKRSCNAAESLAEAILRMARVNCNFSTVPSQLSGYRFHACMRICTPGLL